MIIILHAVCGLADVPEQIDHTRIHTEHTAVRLIAIGNDKTSPDEIRSLNTAVHTLFSTLRTDTLIKEMKIDILLHQAAGYTGVSNFISGMRADLNIVWILSPLLLQDNALFIKPWDYTPDRGWLALGACTGYARQFLFFIIPTELLNFSPPEKFPDELPYSAVIITNQGNEVNYASFPKKFKSFFSEFYGAIPNQKHFSTLQDLTDYTGNCVLTFLSPVWTEYPLGLYQWVNESLRTNYFDVPVYEYRTNQSRISQLERNFVVYIIQESETVNARIIGYRKEASNELLPGYWKKKR